MKGVLASSPARWTTPAPSVPGFHERAYLYVSLLGARNHSRTLPAMGEHNKNWSTQNFIYLLSCKALSQLRCAPSHGVTRPPSSVSSRWRIRVWNNSYAV